MRYRAILEILILVLLVGGVTACLQVGEMMEETQTVQLGEAESVELKLKMGSGKLELQGGAGELMEGYFSYNVDRWKPVVNYHVTGKRGILVVRQGRSSGVPMGKTRNIWDISLNNDIPIDINVDFGAGAGELDFRRLRLKSLDVEMGVGELKVDLTGERKQNLEVDIEGGIGSATVYLPEDVGVRVKVDKGIGSVSARGMNKTGKVYTNDAFGKTDVTIDMKIEAGIGSIDLRLK